MMSIYVCMCLSAHKNVYMYVSMFNIFIRSLPLVYMYSVQVFTTLCACKMLSHEEEIKESINQSINHCFP